MPLAAPDAMEGPSLVILRQELQPFVGRLVSASSGNVKSFDPASLTGQKLMEVRSWGKHFLFRIGRRWFRIHFLMYGSYRINDRKEGRDPRLRLAFKTRGKTDEVDFYSCALGPLDRNPDEIYDWGVDPMSERWDELRAIRTLREIPDTAVCDALMDQTIFSGVGNIIKNEVLYRLHLYPMTRLGELSPKELRALAREARTYCFEFLEWKKQYVLKKHWKIFRRPVCPVHGTKPIREKTGKLQRWSFHCPRCQPMRQLRKREVDAA